MNFKKDILPYIIIAILFFAVAAAYCYPVLQGKVIGNADGVNGTAAVQECLNYRHAEGGNSWWTGALFSGMPNYQIGGAHYLSENILRPFYRFFHWGHSNQIMTIFFYLIAFFLLLRSFGVGRWMSAAGAFAIAFSSYFLIIIGANHGGKTSSLAWMTLMMAGMLLIYRKKYGWGSAMVMFFTAMGLTPHPQMAYYVCLMTGVVWCAELYIHIKEKRMKQWAVATLLFFASFAIGVGVTSANTFANREYMTQTMRGGHSDLHKDAATEASDGGLDIYYATQWSYGIDETLTFLVPNYMGGSSNYELGRDSKLYKQLVSKGVQPQSAASFCASVPTYWGEQPFTAGPVYLGAIICLLFVLGLFIVKGPYKWALLVATLFSVLLSWGYHFMPFTRLFFNWFPLYDKFRTVSSILVVAEITVPLLGFLALKEIAEDTITRKQVEKALAWSAGITGGICLVLALFGGSLLTFAGPGDTELVAYFKQQGIEWIFPMIVDQRAALLSADAWRSLLFIALGAGVVWLMASGKLKQGWAAALLGVLVLVDLWGVDRRFFNESYFQSPRQFESNFAIQPWEKEVLEDDGLHFRVFNVASGNPFAENRTSYRLKSVGGYSAAKLRRYQDLIDEHLTQMHLPVFNMLNTRYFIVDDGGQVRPMLNSDALGNAWFVDSLRLVGGADAECAALMEVDLSRTAVVDADAFGGFTEGFKPAGEDAAVNLTLYKPDRLEYGCDSPDGGTIVFSEIYYPFGWKAYIDDAPAEHFRANYTLRAMNVPAGKHTIRFEFRPDSVRRGDAFSMVCIVMMFGAMILFAVTSIVRVRRRGCTRPREK